MLKITCMGSEDRAFINNVVEKNLLDRLTVQKTCAGIVELAKLLGVDENNWVHLPFCHTLEVENLGAEVIFDFEKGNRIKTVIFKDPESLLKLNPLDINTGRIAEFLKAIKLLALENHKIIYNLSGPVSVITSLIGELKFYKTLRKNPELSTQLMAFIEETLITMGVAALNAGATILSLADPAGSLDILGEPTYKNIIGPSTIRIISGIIEKKPAAKIQLCNKLSRSLEATGFLDVQAYSIEKMNYLDALNEELGLRKESQLIWCHGCTNSNPLVSTLYYGVIRG